MHYSQKRNFLDFGKDKISKFCTVFSLFYAHFTDIKKNRAFLFLHKQYIVAGLDLLETFQQLICLRCGFSFHLVRVALLH